jgi:Ca2+:H+ antiporter
MDTAMTITYQSSIQIALFAVPFLVLVSWLMHSTGMSPHELNGQRVGALNLIFSPMEVVAVVLTVGIVIVICMNGESNWFEGVLLLGLYAILAIAFFYIPASAGGAVESPGVAAHP